MERDSKIAPFSAVIEFPDEDNNQLHNILISSQPSNKAALSKGNWNVQECNYMFHTE